MDDDIFAPTASRLTSHHSQKLYKEKFKEWHWQKNLPANYARFMTDKARKRKRENGKETVFVYGGQTWTKERMEKSAKRARRDENAMDINTPAGVSYKTPKAPAASPTDPADSPGSLDVDRSPERDAAEYMEVMEIVSSGPDSSDEDSSEPASDVQVVADETLDLLPLNWRGLTRSDLLAMWISANNCSQRGDWEEAEDMFSQVIQGYRHILGSTHEDTVKAAYALANLHAENHHMADADEVIEDVTRDMVMKLGHEHRRTQQHVLHAVQLLNSWGREADALGLLAHSKELLQTTGSQHRHRRNGKGKGLAPPPRGAPPMTLRGVTELMAEDPSLANLTFGLGFSRPHIAAKDEAVEALLVEIICQCQASPGGLEIQHLKAQGELLGLYEKLDAVDEHLAAFQDAEAVFQDIWVSYPWDRDEFSSFEALEAGLELAAKMFRCGYEAEAGDMFKVAEDKARELFGSDDERTVWTLISIGMVYQTCATWYEAMRWFEGAFALALSMWSDDGGIVKALQRGLDTRHFSYLSGEGRPFKTIFGVCGVTIRPGRLHLD